MTIINNRDLLRMNRRRTILSLAISLSAIFILTIMAGCERPAKTIRLQFKLTPGLATTYNSEHRSESVAMIGDSVVSRSSSSSTRLYYEHVDSLAGDSAAWVSVKSETDYQSSKVRDTVVVDTGTSISKYMYLGRPSGEIIDIVPVTNVDEKWVDRQLEFLRQAQPSYPATDMSVGFSWTQTTKVQLPDDIREASLTYKVKSFVRERGYDCVVLEFEGLYHMPIKKTGESSVVTGVNRTTTQGTIYFAYREGIIVSDRSWWVVNSDRTVVETVVDENGEKSETTEEVTVVIEGDSKSSLTKFEPGTVVGK